MASLLIRWTESDQLEPIERFVQRTPPGSDPVEIELVREIDADQKIYRLSSTDKRITKIHQSVLNGWALNQVIDGYTIKIEN